MQVLRKQCAQVGMGEAQGKISCKIEKIVNFAASSLRTHGKRPKTAISRVFLSGWYKLSFFGEKPLKIDF